MTSSELTYDLIDREPVYFERALLTRILYDVPFAKLIGGVLFCDSDGQEARSFQMPKHAGLAQVILKYHAHSAPVNPVSWEFMQHCMTEVAGMGKLPVQELQSVWEYFTQMLQSNMPAWDLIMAQTGMGCTYWLKQMRCSQIQQKAKTEKWRADKLQDRLRHENAYIDSLTRTEQLSFDIWEVLRNPQPDVVRLRTSIAQLNLRLAGGFGMGEGYLFIGASGSGKTVLSTQFASEWSLAGKRGILVTTERSQGTAQLLPRILSQHCRIPYSQIVNGIDPSRLQPTQQQAMAEFSQLVNAKNFRVLEWFKRQNKGLDKGLKDELLREADLMGGLDYFLVDWIGGVLDEEGKKDDKKIRLAYQTGADAIAALAGELNCVGGAFAQAHNKTGKNKVRVVAADLQECKSMDRDMTGVIGCSAMESKDIAEDGGGDNYDLDQYFNISKARKGPGGLVPVRRDFGYQRYIDRLTIRK